MNTTQDASRQSVADALEALLAKRFSGADRKLVTTLARQFYHRVPEEELDHLGLDSMAAISAQLLGFIRDRQPGVAKINVYNPELEQHGWSSGLTVVEMVNDDMPFLVDSVSVALAEQDIAIHRIIHPVLRAQRDDNGNLNAIAEQDTDLADGVSESLMHLVVDRQSDGEELDRLHAVLQKTLADVRAAVEDWQAMLKRAVESAERLSEYGSGIDRQHVEECRKFLRWLMEDHFIFLGIRDYRVVNEDGQRYLEQMEGSGLGILRGGPEPAQRREIASLPGGAWSLGTSPQLIFVTKTNARSTMHRVGYLDYIGLLSYDDSGQVVRERRILGLFTSIAYNRSAWDTPLVQPKVDGVVERSGLRPGSHAYKALVHILETLPRDELLQADTDDLYPLASGILNLQERQRTKLFIRPEQFGRFYSCMVFIPRDRFKTEVREAIQSILRKALNGEKLDYVVQVSESVLARLHVVVRPKPGSAVQYDEGDIENQIIEAVRSWRDELREILIQKHGEAEGLRLANQFGRAFPISYTEDVSPWVAAFDVDNAAALEGADDLRMSLYRPRKRRVGLLRFKIFKHGTPIPLSDVLPMLENLGLRIVNERPYELHMPDGASLWVQDFDMVPDDGGDLDINAVRDDFQQAFEKAFTGLTESDGFNRLVVSCQLRWREVMLLRAYCKYLLQTGIPFSQPYMEQTLNAHPVISRLLVELFNTQFNPDWKEQRAGQCKRLARALGTLTRDMTDPVLKEYIDEISERRDGQREGQDREQAFDLIRRAILRALESVRSLDQDRILRAFAEVILATLRTNYYCVDPAGSALEFLSFKLDSSQVPDLPKPRPFREIWVFSSRVEGIHLRMGKVARGGLRWSDRKEDFRTEVLGLMKAQNVKNTMIVPLGAKGGFVVKQLPDSGDRAAVMEEVVYCYKLFINGLLYITDNLDDENILPPANVVRRDEDDPYLVVAADKGTATFSDTANGVAQEHGFWLGDAFASGGSVGYDHKGMGITAKGAWESVKRHFRELGTDIQSQDFTVVGIGDMAGDVFGNGMLLSKHIRLQAAFNHLHIFLDPDPDAGRSFEERRRLFDLPRSSWEDYDAGLISKGGGVYSRQAKTIELSEEVKAWLGLEVDQLSPAELIQELLKAPVDLLWNGGIGTYVKAGSESHADVGDLANNPLRVNGGELRCKVVGEGGNLGLTQLGRIEYAMAGGRINTDFIDNSAGVDCSDHEVNIKILLNQVMQQGELDEKARNALLAEMTDEVADLVLRSNYLQTQAISMMEKLTGPRLGAKAHFIAMLENDGVLDRELEFLPDDDELKERRNRGLGLSRPELSVLLSYSKIELYQQLLSSDVPEDPYLSNELIGYFPKPLQQRYTEQMGQHRLKREIIATMVTNSMVNRMGASFTLRMHEDTGASPAQVAKAYTIAREVFNARELWSVIESTDNRVAAELQTRTLLMVWNLLRQATRWLLNQPAHSLDIQQQVGRLTAGVLELQHHLPEWLTADERALLDQTAAELAAGGFKPEFATRLAGLQWLVSALDIVDEATRRDLQVRQVANVYYQLGERMNLKWLRQQVESLPVDGQWHAHARGNLRDELYSQHRALTGQVLAGGGHDQDAVDAWLERHRQEASRPIEMLSDMRSLPNMDYATVSVAVRGLEQLVLATS